MATQDLNVKFKIDSSDVKKGSDEAKRKVKSTAEEMASDVKNSSEQMSNSFQDVADNAQSAAKQMEKSFDSSAKNMEKSMESVNKKVSAMQLFHLGARGVGMLGGVAQNLMRLNGDREGAESLGTAVGVAEGGFQGAAVGFAAGGAFGAAGGAFGAAVGALVGAGNALLEAAVKQKEAAEAVIENNRDVIESAETANNDRILSDWAAKTASARDFDVDFAEDQIAAAKERISQAKADLNEALDIAKGRTSTQYNGVGIKVDGKTLLHGQDFGNVDWTDKSQTAKIEEQLGPTLFKYVHELITDNVKEANKELAAATKELAILAPLQERIAKEKEKIAGLWDKTQSMWGYGADAKAFDDYQNGADLKEKLKTDQASLADYQRQLQGVISHPASSPSDALTRIGGGRGYAAYNNSTANVQKQIEEHLRSVIDLLKESISETSSRLEALIAKKPEMAWAYP